MSNLEIVKQESKSDLLMPGPMPHEEMKIGRCPYPLSRGSREGQPCNEKTFDGEELCSTHQILVAKSKSKNEVPVREIFVSANVSEPQAPIINVGSSSHSLPPVPVALPPSNAPIDEILVIMRNFSIAMVNLTELLKRH